MRINKFILVISIVLSIVFLPGNFLNFPVFAASEEEIFLQEETLSEEAPAEEIELEEETASALEDEEVLVEEDLNSPDDAFPDEEPFFEEETFPEEEIPSEEETFVEEDPLSEEPLETDENIPEEQPEEPIEDQEEEDDSLDIIELPYASDYLFIGNSLTYVNNLPSMFEQMVSAGTHTTITTEAAVYSGRSLSEHADAIAAVIRTQGNESLLTPTERSFFYDSYANRVFSSVVYQNYANVIWDSVRNQPKKYKNVVLQTYYNSGAGDSSAEKVRDAIDSIINSMNSETTSYLVNSTWNRFEATFSQTMQQQDQIDAIVSQGVEKYLEEHAFDKYASLTSVYSGRALMNYLQYTGKNRAQEVEPDAYSVYQSVGLLNDLIYGDSIHPTQLGTYLESACLYSSIFGNAASISNTYYGGISTSVQKVDGKDGVNFAVLYNNGQGFSNSLLTAQAAFIADQTVNGHMVLSSAADAFAWKADSIKANQDELNKIKISFQRGGATFSSFYDQTFVYNGMSQSFRGNATRKGYTLAGWATYAGASAAEYKPNQTVSNTLINHVLNEYRGSLTLYPVWQPETITVQFQGNGATVNTFGTKRYIYDVDGQSFTGKISRPGYIFKGWALKKNASAPDYSAFANVRNNFITTMYHNDIYKGKVILYAVWHPKSVIVRFDGNGATSNTYKTQTYVYGKSNQKFVGSIARKGYRFLGWSTAKNASVPMYSANANVRNGFVNLYSKATEAGKVTLYAVWGR